MATTRSWSACPPAGGPFRVTRWMTTSSTTIIRRADIVSPWTVGRYHTPRGRPPSCPGVDRSGSRLVPRRGRRLSAGRVSRFQLAQHARRTAATSPAQSDPPAQRRVPLVPGGRRLPGRVPRCSTWPCSTRSTKARPSSSARTIRRLGRARLSPMKASRRITIFGLTGQIGRMLRGEIEATEELPGESNTTPDER